MRGLGAIVELKDVGAGDKRPVIPIIGQAIAAPSCVSVLGFAEKLAAAIQIRTLPAYDSALRIPWIMAGRFIEKRKHWRSPGVRWIRFRRLRKRTQW